MNKLSDEILNRYIDNELDQATLKMVRDQLERSEEDKKRLLALQSVEKSLKNMKLESVSSDFTSKLMKRIIKKSNVNKEQRIFIFSISSVFVVIALGIFGYVLSLILQAPTSPDGAVTGTRETVNVLENIMVPIKNFFSKVNISVIGSVFSLGLLISVYFVLDVVKHTKRTLSRQH